MAASVVARTLRLSCPPSDVGAVHDLVGGLWRRDGSPHERDRMRFETALVELTSAIVARAPGGASVTCDIHVIALPGTLEADLSDDLPSRLDLPALADLPALPDQTLVRALVDEVSYRQAGDRNTWRLVVARSDAPPREALSPARDSTPPAHPTTGLL